MANTILRQNDLFVAEDWDVVYEAFANVSFKTYSFDSIKVSLIKYLRENYPEDFNDWTENSEFIMLIDLLAYLGESISYRVDLNTRDNFIDTAERKDSVLKLARMLSYNPSRNKAASGKVKIKSITTSQYIVDSNGRNLQNRPIIWNDPQNPDWYEQFILVMNHSFNITNKFGKPSKSTTSNGIIKQLYHMNNTLRSNVTKKFSATVSGENMDFEIYNPDMGIDGSITELHPDPNGAMNMIYLNDGSGNASANTGFFMYFKQGTLKFNSYNYANPIENRVELINVPNINEDDVWVSKVNSNGDVIDEWNRVDSLESNSYNSYDKTIRNIFTIQTLNDDKINIRYPDGNTGNVPKGLMRVWYRQSNGLEYTINPQDIRGKGISLQYKSNNGSDNDTSFTLNINFDLMDIVNNSAPTESVEDIKERAPRVYYTQNRMTNGEDYNSYPLTHGQNVLKVKAVNRVYSGQSPFFNNYDPTKRYSSTVEFGDDGALYKDDYQTSTQEIIPTTKTPQEIVTSRITPLISDINSFLFYIDRTTMKETSNYFWIKTTETVNQSTGYFVDEHEPGHTYELSPTEPYPSNIIVPGAYLRFEKDGKIKYAKVISVENNGFYVSDDGPVVLDENIDDRYEMTGIIPYFRQTLSTPDIERIASLIDNNNTFGLAYDFETDRWRIIDELNVSPVDTKYSTEYSGDNINANRDASWVIRVQYTPFGFTFVARQTRYIFESEKISRFYFNPEGDGTNLLSAESQFSNIEIMTLNIDKITGNRFVNPMTMRFYDTIKYADGFIDPQRIVVVPYDLDKDGSYDNPNLFARITSSTDELDQIVILKASVVDGYRQFNIVTDVLIGKNQTDFESYDFKENPLEYSAAYSLEDDAFFSFNNGRYELISNGNYKAFVGRANMIYKYEHFANENSRIDPAITNVIDMYVLTNAYHSEMTKWKNSNRTTPMPLPAQSNVLQDEFSSLDRYKMISDQMLWNAAKYTPLFGDYAIEENRANFKAVKIPNSKYTDNQLKQEILNAIEEFFDISRWDFGETIYVSELCAYIHQKLAPELAFVTLIRKETNEIIDMDVYQIRQEFNCLPLNTATVDDIVIVSSASTSVIKNGLF